VPRNVRAPLAGCLACTAGLGLVALFAYGSESVQTADRSLRDRLLAEPGSTAHSVAATAMHLGDPVALVLLTALACGIGVARGMKHEAVAGLFVIVGANLTTQLLKILVSHPRFRSLFGAEQFAWDGFPSGHTTAVASLTIAFAFVSPARARPFVLGLGACLTVVVGGSMVVLHRHFPSDIAGGALVAAAWGFGALAVLRATAGAPGDDKGGGRKKEGDRTRPAAHSPRRAAISVK